MKSGGKRLILRLTARLSTLVLLFIGFIGRRISFAILRVIKEELFLFEVEDRLVFADDLFVGVEAFVEIDEEFALFFDELEVVEFVFVLYGGAFRGQVDVFGVITA